MDPCGLKPPKQRASFCQNEEYENEATRLSLNRMVLRAALLAKLATNLRTCARRDSTSREPNATSQSIECNTARGGYTTISNNVYRYMHDS